MTESYDVVVIGGGVIGMTSAWRLAQTRRRVLLLEQNFTGAGASSAAAGMLGAQLEVSAPGSFYQLCLESRSLYQAFVDELFEQTGIDTQLTHNGIYQIAFSEEEVSKLQQKLAWQVEGGVRAEFLSSAEVNSQEPTLAMNQGALFLPDDSNIQAPLLVRALQTAVKQICSVLEGVEVTEIVSQGRSGYAVFTQSDTYFSESVVIATGAWASRLLPASPIHVQPVKGQLLAIRPRGAQQLKHTVFSQHTYLVPKRDGTIVVGATEDREAGFNRDVTADAIHHLLSEVERIAPALSNSAFEKSWTGIRPGSYDGYPWIGELPESPGLHVAVGHFRNGILLAPVTANMIVASLERQQWPSHWQKFHVTRRSTRKVVPPL